jgi:hypothetical protein
MGWWRGQRIITGMSGPRPCAVLLVLIAGLAVVAAVSGCAQQQPVPSSTPSLSTASSFTSTTATTAGPAPTVGVTSSSTASTAPTTTTTTTTLAVSSDSIAYAKSLGGTSHEGQRLYLVIGASVESEQAAQAMLEKATPLFGDMQSYFVVQLSDNFEGLEPGWWVVIEVYRGKPSADNLAFDRRGFPDAYVKQATVRTSDPLPVYEDMVGGE